MKRILFSLAVACTSNLAAADEFIVHTVSWHSHKTYSTDKVVFNAVNQQWEYESLLYNNTNFGLGYLFKRPESALNNVAVGVYHNSQHAVSAYAAKFFMLPLTEGSQPVQFGAMLGGATGYPHNRLGWKIMPLGAAVLKMPVTTKFNITVLAAPTGIDNGGVAHLAVSYSLR